jgi:hypothetical protein
MVAPHNGISTVQILARFDGCKNLHTKKRINTVDFMW